MREVFLDDSRILAMSINPLLTSRFPFLLKTVTRGDGGCANCKKRADLDYASIKQAVVNLPAEKKEELKKLLKVATISVILPGQSSAITF